MTSLVRYWRHRNAPFLGRVLQEQFGHTQAPMHFSMTLKIQEIHHCCDRSQTKDEFDSLDKQLFLMNQESRAMRVPNSNTVINELQMYQIYLISYEHGYKYRWCDILAHFIQV